MNNRSQWMEGLLWEEDRIQNRGVKTLAAQVAQLRWELLYSGAYGSVYDEGFVIGALDYLDYVEVRDEQTR